MFDYLRVLGEPKPPIKWLDLAATTVKFVDHVGWSTYVARCLMWPLIQVWPLWRRGWCGLRHKNGGHIQITQAICDWLRGFAKGWSENAQRMGHLGVFFTSQITNQCRLTCAFWLGWNPRYPHCMDWNEQASIIHTTDDRLKLSNVRKWPFTSCE